MSTTNRVTTLPFSWYNPEEFIIPSQSNLSLNAINKALLMLFHNDIYVYTLLVGKVKGLWWKYWYADVTKPGYAAGDMICANNIGRVEFLKKYWQSVKEIADTRAVLSELPAFSLSDEDILQRYLNALSEYFYLGVETIDRQLYLSLKDDNKERVTTSAAWQPYLVTEEELLKRNYLFSALLGEAVQAHLQKYHTGLDKLDKEDQDYEEGKADESRYTDTLLKYYPRQVLQGKEDTDLVAALNQGMPDQLSQDSSLQDVDYQMRKLLGLREEVYDFLHITKPLGDEVHRLETWLRTDGHVRVAGYMPVSMLTEIIPKVDTIEYNKWKAGGMRNYAFRLDYLINDQISQLYFAKPEEKVEETQSTPAPQRAVFQRAGLDTTSYDSTLADLQEKCRNLQNALTQWQTTLSQYKPVEEDSTARFPSPMTDLWCKDEHLIYGEGVINTSLIELQFVAKPEVAFQFNPETIQSTDKDQLIDEVYKKDSSVVTLYSGPYMLNQIDNPSHPGWRYWKVSLDITTQDPDTDRYTRRVILTFKDLTTAILSNLIYYGNEDVLDMTSSIDGRLGDFLIQCVGNRFEIDSFEVGHKKETLTGRSFLYTDVVENKADHTTKEQTKSVTGTIELQCDVLKVIRGKANRKPPVESGSKVESIRKQTGDLTSDMLKDNKKARAEEVYTLLSYTKGSGGTVVFYPSKCVTLNGDEPTETPVPFADILTEKPNTATKQMKALGQEDIFDDLMDDTKYKEMPGLTTAGDTVGEIHRFIVKDIAPAPSGGSSGTGEDEDKPTDFTVVASDMRLYRNLGFVRSPVLDYVTHATVLPDAASLMMPSLIQTPTVHITDWTWRNGQTIVFSVPSATQNISFDVAGMLKSDCYDLSLYEPQHEEWLSDIIRYKRDVAILRYAATQDSDAQAYLLGDGLFIAGLQPIIEGLEDALLKNKLIPIMMSLRLLEHSSSTTVSGPKTKLSEFLQVLDDKAGSWVPSSETNQESDNGFTAIWNLYNDWMDYECRKFRFDALYSYYAELGSEIIATDQVNATMLEALRQYLATQDTNKIDEDMETHLDKATQILTSLASSVHQEQESSNISTLMTDFNNVITRVGDLYNVHVARMTLIGTKVIDIDPLDTNFLINAKNKFEANCKEIQTYVDELMDVGAQFGIALQTLGAYLEATSERDARDILERKITQLKESLLRYARVNTEICRGYIHPIDLGNNTRVDRGYLPKWRQILNVSDEKGSYYDTTKAKVNQALVDILRAIRDLCKSGGEEEQDDN